MRRRNRVQIEDVNSEMSEVIKKLEEAILSGDKNLVAKLVSENEIKGSHRFTQGDTILHLAVRSTNPEMVDFVLSNVPEIDFQAQNRRANTPLCLAVQLARPNTQAYSPDERKALRNKFEKICLSLIKKDADLSNTANIKNLMRKSAIDYLNKVVRIPSVQQALDKKIIAELAKQAQISPETKKQIQSVPHEKQFLSFRSTSSSRTR